MFFGFLRDTVTQRVRIKNCLKCAFLGYRESTVSTRTHEEAEEISCPPLFLINRKSSTFFHSQHLTCKMVYKQIFMDHLPGAGTRHVIRQIGCIKHASPLGLKDIYNFGTVICFRKKLYFDKFPIFCWGRQHFYKPISGFFPNVLHSCPDIPSSE